MEGEVENRHLINASERWMETSAVLADGLNLPQGTFTYTNLRNDLTGRKKSFSAEVPVYFENCQYSESVQPCCEKNNEAEYKGRHK